jgi:hypothetical protein
MPVSRYINVHFKLLMIYLAHSGIIGAGAIHVTAAVQREPVQVVFGLPREPHSS